MYLELVPLSDDSVPGLLKRKEEQTEWRALFEY